MVVIPVIFGLVSSCNFFLIGTLEIWSGINLHFDFLNPEGENTHKIVSYIVGGIDYYLIGIVLLFFSLGVYELFVSKIHIRFKDKDIKILQIESLEELKNKLIQVIIVALIVSLFKKMLGLRVQTTMDLVLVASSILLISISSYFLKIQDRHKKEYKPN